MADAVATQDTITQLITAIRRVGRIVPGGAEAIGVVCTRHDYSKPAKPVIDWDEPGAKDFGDVSTRCDNGRVGVERSRLANSPGYQDVDNPSR